MQVIVVVDPGLTAGRRRQLTTANSPFFHPDTNGLRTPARPPARQHAGPLDYAPHPRGDVLGHGPGRFRVKLPNEAAAPEFRGRGDHQSIHPFIYLHTSLLHTIATAIPSKDPSPSTPAFHLSSIRERSGSSPPLRLRNSINSPNVRTVAVVAAPAAAASWSFSSRQAPAPSASHGALGAGSGSARKPSSVLAQLDVVVVLTMRLMRNHTHAVLVGE